MLPRWHIVLGFVFSILYWILFPRTDLIYIVLIFLSSFLIDFDHYLNALSKTGSVSLRKAFEYHKVLGEIEKYEQKKGIKRKSDFEIFHTFEFHLLVLLLSFVWIGFFYIFLGMLFHSIIDIISMIYAGRLYSREFFLFNWILRQFNF